MLSAPAASTTALGPNGESVVPDLGDDAGDSAHIGVDQANVGVDDDPGPSLGRILEIGGERRSLGSDPASHGAIAAVLIGAAVHIAGHLVDVPSQIAQDPSP